MSTPEMIAELQGIATACREVAEDFIGSDRDKWRVDEAILIEEIIQKGQRTADV
jgi:hypothetical protein